MKHKELYLLQQEADQIQDTKAKEIIAKYQKIVFNILEENKILQEELLKDSYWDEDLLT